MYLTKPLSPIISRTSVHVPDDQEKKMQTQLDYSFYVLIFIRPCKSIYVKDEI